MRLAGLIAALLLLRLTAYAVVAGGLAALPDQLCQWDCTWYMHTATAGYDLVPLTAPPHDYGQANWAFFPVYPLAISLLAAALPLSFRLAGLMVSGLALAVFLYLAALYWRRTRPLGGERGLVVFLVVFPYGLYFSLPYTESLYAALVMAMLLLLEAKQGLAAAAVSAVLVAVRITGILLVPALAAYLLWPAVTAWRQGQHRLAITRLADAALPLAIAPLGLFLFMAYLHARMGDGLAMLHVQVAWLRHTALPFTGLATGLTHFDLRNIFASSQQSVCFSMLCGLAGLFLTLRLACQYRWAEAWFLCLSVLVALSAGYVSVQRYVLCNPICLLALFDLIWSSPLRRHLPFLAVAGAVLQLYLVHNWVHSYVSLM
jgi:hypothetical protein